MNHVILSGTVLEQPISVGKDDAAAHVVFKLIVKHRAKTGIRSELYSVSAWHKCADFCEANLQKGMRVAVTGYLTQRSMVFGEKKVQAVEVTASEIMLAQPVFTPSLTTVDTAHEQKEVG